MKKCDTCGYKVGDVIKIICMKGEPRYTDKIGEITMIDDSGQLHGTWGGLAVQADYDSIEKIEAGKYSNIIIDRFINDCIDKHIYYKSKEIRNTELYVGDSDDGTTYQELTIKYDDGSEEKVRDIIGYIGHCFIFL